MKQQKYNKKSVAMASEPKYFIFLMFLTLLATLQLILPHLPSPDQGRGAAATHRRPAFGLAINSQQFRVAQARSARNSRPETLNNFVQDGKNDYFC
ncbi:MAG: hypothetical protein IJ724_01515 [Muribaculaceae bacterium]|nr:hypothetical protein [Muribaculaceae bacterium]